MPCCIASPTSYPPEINRGVGVAQPIWNPPKAADIAGVRYLMGPYRFGHQRNPHQETRPNYLLRLRGPGLKPRAEMDKFNGRDSWNRSIEGSSTSSSIVGSWYALLLLSPMLRTRNGCRKRMELVKPSSTTVLRAYSLFTKPAPAQLGAGLDKLSAKDQLASL